MVLLLLLIWFVPGLIGSILLYLNQAYRDSVHWCPTPLQILQIVAVSFVGPPVLFPALVFWWTDWSYHLKHRTSWWTTPICKKKDK